MQNEIFEKMTEASKTSYAALQELSAINSKVLKELTELQMGLATYSIESGVEFTKALSTTNNYKDFMSAEAEYANEYGNKVLEFSRKTADVLNESRDEVVAWFEKTVESATKETKTAPKRTSKKAA
ncbi:MAG: phasin family protein [Proteobacteria bacterium]|nr:phasin family protein [Pseudomonadota bacterium]